MNIVPLTQNNFSSALALLKKNKLPTEDISEVTTMFVLEEGQSVIGTVAFEIHGNDGLLRSLSIAEEKRNLGLGKELVSFIEAQAIKHGLRNLYLLTTTADRFFLARGYVPAGREQAPPLISQSTEFSSLCPATAVLMKKELS